MRVVVTSSKTYFNMGIRSDKLRQSHVYCLRDKLKLTCLNHGHVHSSEQYKVLNGFGTRYDASSPFKERRNDHKTSKKYNNEP